MNFSFWPFLWFGLPELTDFEAGLRGLGTRLRGEGGGGAVAAEGTQDSPLSNFKSPPLSGVSNPMVCQTYGLPAGSYKQGVEGWLSENHGNHRSHEKHGNPGYKPRVARTMGLEMPDIIRTEQVSPPSRKPLVRHEPQEFLEGFLKYPLIEAGRHYERGLSTGRILDTGLGSLELQIVNLRASSVCIFP